MNVPKNAEKYAKIILHSVSRPVCVRCLVVHKVGEGVTERHVALAKKNWKKREIEGSDGKLLVNCGKKVKKREGKREKG